MRKGMERIRPNQNAVSGKWARLKTSNFWQAAFVRPFSDKTNWKKFMATWLSYAFGLLLIVAPTSMLIDDALSWPVQLDQMQSTSGRLSSVVIQRRGPSYLVVTTASGDEVRFYARWLPGADVETHVGHGVTVWSRDGFELFHGRIHVAVEMRLEDESRFVLGYTERIPAGIEYDEKDHYWLLAMLMFGMFLIARPIWQHRKPFIESQQTIERGA